MYSFLVPYTLKFTYTQTPKIKQAIMRSLITLTLLLSTMHGICQALDAALITPLQYRNVGPFRGGRSAAVCGSYKYKSTFYMGATGGGVFKTTDGGSNWKNISDGYFGGSIGAVAVAPSDETIVYAAEGEHTMRGNVSEGLGGIWRSTNAGKTWVNLGLADARHIIKIIIHPKNPDIVWVAAMGHLFGPNATRGVYHTTNGGTTWTKQLYINDLTGCSDLTIEPNNPTVLYAGMWRVQRTPYSLISGGTGSGLYKSIDGGSTWTNITTNKGLPKGTWGIVGIAIAPTNTDKLYCILENSIAGGVYMSTNAGNSWVLTSSDNNIKQRAWYYTKITVDPKNDQKVYAKNVGLMVSTDGAKTFAPIRTPHGDHHELWIDPEDANRMIVADDGGAQVSYDAGKNWSTADNQPTAQIYRVSTDNSFPYRILGAQQDNSTIRIKHRTYSNGITQNDWMPTAGAESGYVVADPLNPEIVYGGNYGGYLSRLNHTTGENRAITVWPDNPLGAGADVQQYRFQWNFPIFFSPHNPKRLYCAGNALFVTENEGASWQQLSGDLTTNDKAKQASSGGPITQDNTSVEYYCTIFTATESTLEKDLLYTGSDDGLVYISNNAGLSWKNITPKSIPTYMMWNSIETDPTTKGTAYIVGTRYKLDDYTPYIYYTKDYGATWELITKGIPPMHFARVLRADAKRPGLLYAGTEYGMYISYNYGKQWTSLQLNLPTVPITDITLKENAMILATQGRAFWMLDDLSLLQQYNTTILGKSLHVYNVQDAWRITAGHNTPANAGANPPSGAVINYYVASITDTTKASITILDNNKQVIKTITTTDANKPIELAKGTNQYVWDMHYPAGEKTDGMILWNGAPSPILAPPGQYYAVVKVAKDSNMVPFIIKAEANYTTTQQAYEAQFAFTRKAQATFDQVQKAIKEIKTLRTQINDFNAKQPKPLPTILKAKTDSILTQLTAIEEALYQTKAKSSQDVLNYPIRLNDKLSGVIDVANSGNMAPSKQVQEVYELLAKACTTQLNKLAQLKLNNIAQLNKYIRDNALPVIGVAE